MSGVEISDDMMMDALVKVRLAPDSFDRGILDKYAKDLSGGEQQRLSLARIMIDSSPLLILDEPLTGVDVYTIKDTMPSFREILKHKSRTVILISHKLSFLNCADYVILLDKQGKIKEQGNPQILLNDPISTLKNLYNVAMEELHFDNQAL